LEITPESALVVLGQHAEEEDFLLEDGFPFRGERLREDLPAAAELACQRPVDGRGDGQADARGPGDGRAALVKAPSGQDRNGGDDARE
jgi:hypothetical protein